MTNLEDLKYRIETRQRNDPFRRKIHKVPNDDQRNSINQQHQKAFQPRNAGDLSKTIRKQRRNEGPPVKILGDILHHASNQRPQYAAPQKAYHNQARRREKAPMMKVGLPNKLSQYEPRAPNKFKEQKTYKQIRDDFEYASGHANPIYPTELRSDTDTSEEEESISYRIDIRQEADTGASRKSGRSKPLGGVPLVGLDEHISNLADKRSERPRAKRADNQTILVQGKRHGTSKRRSSKPSDVAPPTISVTEKESETQKKSKEEISEASDKSMETDTNLLARRIRQIPVRGNKGKFHLFLEEIHQLPPLVVKSSELSERLQEKNAEYFEEILFHPTPSLLEIVKNPVEKPLKIIKPSKQNCYQKVVNFFKKKEQDSDKIQFKQETYTRNGTKIVYD